MNDKDALLNAAIKGDIADIISLCSREEVNPQNFKDAFVAAARRGYLEAVAFLYEKLLSIKADVNVLNSAHKWTAMDAAACFGHIQVVEFLLEKRPIIKTYQHYNALLFAVIKGHIKIAEKLIHYDKELVNTYSTNYMPLTAAAWSGNEAMVSCLIENGAHLDGKPNSIISSLFEFIDTTPIIEATKQGHISIVRLLLEKGTTLNRRDSQGENALFYAIRAENLELVQYLIAKGIDTAQNNYEGDTPLSVAQGILESVAQKGVYTSQNMMEQIVILLETQKEYNSFKDKNRKIGIAYLKDSLLTGFLRPL